MAEQAMESTLVTSETQLELYSRLSPVFPFCPVHWWQLLLMQFSQPSLIHSSVGPVHLKVCWSYRKGPALGQPPGDASILQLRKGSAQSSEIACLLKSSMQQHILSGHGTHLRGLNVIELQTQPTRNPPWWLFIPSLMLFLLHSLPT